MGDYCAPFGSVSGEVYYTYTATADGYLNISSTDSKAVIFFLYEHVIANGDNVSSRSENGEVIGNSEYLLEITAGGVVSIQVSTSDWQTAKIPFSLSYLAEKPVDESLGSKANPYELSLGETTAVAPVGTFSLYYAFTPTTTAKYTIYSLDDSGESVFIYLYDSNFKTLKRSTGNSGYTGEGYGIGYNMQAGVTYYVEVSKGVGEGFTLVFNTQK